MPRFRLKSDRPQVADNDYILLIIDRTMTKRVYVKPTIEIEVLAVEQGFLLSTDFEVPGGGNYGDENDNWA